MRTTLLRRAGIIKIYLAGKGKRKKKPPAKRKQFPHVNKGINPSSAFQAYQHTFLFSLQAHHGFQIQ